MVTEGKKVAIYARVSTTDQTAENQVLDLRKYCTARGWKIAEEFTDTGISGSKEDRPALKRLMDAVRKGRVDSVLVWRFDRFARSVPHLVGALQEFRECNVGFTSYQEGIDTATPQGKMVFTFLAAIAEFELNILSERIKAGHRRTREQGTHIGRPAVPADKVAAIRALHAEHVSYKNIAIRVGLSKSTVGKILNPAAKVVAGEAVRKP